MDEGSGDIGGTSDHRRRMPGGDERQLRSGADSADATPARRTCTLALWAGSRLGRTHDLTAARRHRVITTCIRLGLPVLGCLGVGGTFTTPQRRRPRQELTLQQRALSKAHAHLRYPVERGMAHLKTWRIFRKTRCSPTRLTTAAKAVLTLESHR